MITSFKPKIAHFGILAFEYVDYHRRDGDVEGATAVRIKVAGKGPTEYSDRYKPEITAAPDKQHKNRWTRAAGACFAS